MKTIINGSGGLSGLKSHWFIIAVLFFSMLIRLYGLDANLPNIYWHDEVNTVEGALRIGAGNLTPQTLQHGMFLALLLAGEYGTYYVLKKAAGIYSTPADLLQEYIHDPSNFYIISRVTVGLFGVACIFLIYLIALKLYNKFVANLSSLFFSASFMSITHSKWTKDDLVATFFILLGFLITLRLLRLPHEKKKDVWRYYAMSGFFIGLATAAKMNAAFSIVFVVIAHLHIYKTNNPQRGGIRCVASLFGFNIIISALSAIIGFIAGNPYALINPYYFCITIATLNKEMIDPGRVSYLLYFTDHLKDVIGSRYLEIFVLISCVYFMFKRSWKTILLLAYPVVLYLFYMNYPGFAHYLIPALPFLFILTAVFVDMIYNKATNRPARALMWAIVLIALSPCFLNILRYGALISKPDTRTLAKEWIEKNVPNNSVILSEGYISTAPTHVPQLKGNLNTLYRDMTLVKASGGSGIPIQEEIRLAGMDKTSVRYDIYKTKVLSIEDLMRGRGDYVVLTGYSDIDLAQREFLREADFFNDRKKFYDTLNKKYRMVKEFVPYPEFGPFFPIFMLGDLKRLETIRPFFGTQPLLQGPVIRIYQKRPS